MSQPNKLFNLCLAASADWASYQAGICQFVHEQYDTWNSPDVLVSGASSGALNGALLLLGDLHPLDTVLGYSDYYTRAHSWACNDVLYLIHDYFVSTLEAAYPWKAVSDAKLADVGRRLYVQLSERDLQNGQLAHGGWTSWFDLVHDLVQSSYIPGVTGPLVQLKGHRLYLDKIDGGFQDCTPRLRRAHEKKDVARADEHGLVWARDIATQPFSTVKPADESVVPHVILSAGTWRERTQVEQVLGLFVNAKREHVLKLARDGYCDARSNRATFDEIQALRKRTTPLQSELTREW